MAKPTEVPPVTQELLDLAREHAEQHAIHRADRLDREHTGVHTSRCPRRQVCNYVLFEKLCFNELTAGLSRDKRDAKKAGLMRKLHVWYKAKGVECRCNRCDEMHGVSHSTE